MASLGHIALGLSAARLHHARAPGRPWKLAILYSALSMLPDADVIAFALGVPYSHPFGHRGATHSISFALLCGVGLFAIMRRPLPALLGAAVVLTHPLLDSLTDGGLGVALFYPLSAARHFAPWTPIPVAPIGAGMLSPRGLYVVGVEAAMFLPAFLYALRPRRQPR